MSTKHGQEASYRLLGILQEYAPNGKAQERCADIYNEAKRSGATEKDLARTMTGAIYDGLAYGNWPWN